MMSRFLLDLRTSLPDDGVSSNQCASRFATWISPDASMFFAPGLSSNDNATYEAEGTREEVETHTIFSNDSDEVTQSDDLE